MKEKVLILGGTEFVGRLVVEALLSDSAKEIYLFNRRRTNPGLFPEIKRIIGDRETADVEKLQGHKWDYVVDFSSYYPSSLKKTLEHINKDVKKYIYISTIAVYSLADHETALKITEAYPLVKCSAAESVDETMKTYGKKKAACEKILQQASWLNTIILRPSIIYGKYDPTDRFYYWLRRIKKASEIIVPDNGEAKLSLTYAGDLVNIILSGINDDLPNGIYNCNTYEPLTLKRILEIMKNLLGSECPLYGIDSQKLKKEGLNFPLLFVRDLWFCNARIKAASGLTFLPFIDSVKEQIKYYEGEDWRACRAGMEEKLEQELIKTDRTAFRQSS